MNSIEMLLDEENELTFQVNIEGNRPSDASCRLRLDNEGVGLMFEASKTSQGEISVVIPPLNHVLKEGLYDMTLEVIVDDKYFQPLTVQGNFEKSVKVTAEAVVRSRKSKTNVTASTLVEKANRVTKPSVSVSNSKSKRVLESREPRKNTQKPVRTATKKSQALKKFSDKDIMNLIEMLVKEKK